MNTFLILGIAILLVAIIIQIARTSEMVAILKGSEQVRKDSNRILSQAFIVFMIVFFTGVIGSALYYVKDFLPESSSEHGVWIDTAFNITLAVTGIVFIATHILLFVFVYIYREDKNRTGYFYPDNHKLEFWWTIIPAIFMTILVVTGLFYWYKITAPAPADAMQVEVVGKQFNWIVRYPGADNTFGKKSFRLINDNNLLGMNWEDEKGKDDVIPSELVLVKGKSVKVNILSRDVMHNFDLVHFNVKMDAVPGIPTSFVLKPRFTTAEMKVRMNDPKFEYELACAQICGESHYAMKLPVRVVEQAEFDKWIKEQKSYYSTIMPSTPVTVDSTAVEAKPIAATH